MLEKSTVIIAAALYCASLVVPVVAAPELTTTRTSWESQGYQAPVTNSGLSGPLSDSKTAGDTLASITADYGSAYVHLSASGHPAQLVGGHYWTSPTDARISGGCAWHDVVTIFSSNAALNGTTGTFIGRFRNSGSGYLLGGAAYASHSAHVTAGACPAFNYTASYGTVTVADVWTTSAFTFTFGTPFDMGVDSTIEVYSGMGGFGGADITLQWAGFDSIVDQNGNSVADYTLSTQSGSRWIESNIVPEPSSLPPLLAFLGALAAGLRKVRSR